MEVQSIKANESPPRVIWIANIAIIISCLAGIPVIMGWIPVTLSPFSDSTVLLKPDKVSTSTAKPAVRKIPTAPALATSNAPTQAKCAECGVIESVSEVNIKSAQRSPHLRRIMESGSVESVH